MERAAPSGVERGVEANTFCIHLYISYFIHWQKEIIIPN